MKLEIPQDVLVPMFTFLRYGLLGSLHLNKVAACVPQNIPVLESLQQASRKRKRIVERLSVGLSPRKLRKFPISRVKTALGDLTSITVDNQIRILESHDVVFRPTRRSVELTRMFSATSRAYLIASCNYTAPEVARLELIAADLTD